MVSLNIFSMDSLNLWVANRLSLSASGIPELFKMKESCVEPGHFTTIFVNLEEENIYKYILALEA